MIFLLHILWYQVVVMMVSDLLIMPAGRATTLPGQAKLPTKQHTAHGWWRGVSLDGLDWIQWRSSICSRSDYIASHFEHTCLHRNKSLDLGFNGHHSIQEKLCDWCSSRDYHWPCLHHSGCRLVLSSILGTKRKKDITANFTLSEESKSRHGTWFT